MNDEKEQFPDKGLLNGKLGSVWKSLEETTKNFLGSRNIRNTPLAGEIIARQQQLLERVMPAVEPPFWLGSVVYTDKEKQEVIVSCQGKLSSVLWPKGIDLKLGDSVKLSSVTGQIVDTAVELDIGGITTVRKVLGIMSEVDASGGARLVFNGTFSESLQPDDRVILDSSGSIIVARLGKGDARFQIGSKPNVSWDDIGGLSQARNELIEAFVLPVKFSKLYQDYQKKRIGGVLLFGPPGCGKTLLIEAIATAVAELHGAEAVESGFIFVRGPEILEPLVGNAERNIRHLFARGRKHEEKHKYPAIIAIDECEAILSRRGSGVSSDMEKTTVPTFLAEMNGLHDFNPIVILATNRHKILDPAVIRDKRISRHIKVPRPDRAAAKTIFALSLKKTLISDGTLVDEMASLATEEFYSDKFQLWEIKKKNGESVPFKLCHLVNGAMIASIIDDKASSAALERDIANKAEKGTGITKDDLITAVTKTFEQKRELDHTDELTEFVEEIRDDILPGGITKVIQKTAP